MTQRVVLRRYKNEIFFRIFRSCITMEKKAILVSRITFGGRLRVLYTRFLQNPDSIEHGRLQ